MSQLKYKTGSWEVCLMLSRVDTWHAIIGQVDLMLGRGSVDRARPLSVAIITAGFPRGTAEGNNQLRKKDSFLSILLVKTPKHNALWLFLLCITLKEKNDSVNKNALFRFLLEKRAMRFIMECAISAKGKNTRIESRENAFGLRKSEQTVKRPSSVTSEPALSVPFSSNPQKKPEKKKEALIN